MVSNRNAASLRGLRRRGPDPSGTVGGAGGGGGPGRWRPLPFSGSLSGASTATGGLGGREGRGFSLLSTLVPPRPAARLGPSTSCPSTPSSRRDIALLYPVSKP